MLGITAMVGIISRIDFKITTCYYPVAHGAFLLQIYIGSLTLSKNIKRALIAFLISGTFSAFAATCTNCHKAADGIWICEKCEKNEIGGQ
ncbi:hypothetical protein EXT46_07515 [Pseudoalteromonas sp. CO325X]|uniref:hypothetical protein n=1 Tax=Pseudoalteromonas sp. CO325X TaxID=1777262 RepID=UPI0010EEDAF9|nr:hypothetical protein [Pseudoalteromonas sp. CO325X]RZF83280.1 hypothetical protein EXT46_07515 [Pseudoalteromonas sp. CO325X]